MKIKKKDLIFIHKFIWAYIYKEVEDYKDRNIINLPQNFNFKEMKNKALSLLLEERIITDVLMVWLSTYNFCVLCLIFAWSEKGCIECLLKDCNSPRSMYQQARKGRLSAIRNIYYSIDEAIIPEYIEIPEE